MEERSAIRIFLFCCILSIIQGFDQGRPINNDDYLDYLTSKRHEIEDALFPQRDQRDLYLKRKINFFDQDEGDFDDDDDDDGRDRFEDDAEEEERDAEEERRRLHEMELKRKKREEKIEKLKKESNNVLSPNHVIEDTESKKSSDNKKSKDQKSKLSKLNKKKKDKKSQQKDQIVKHVKEADSKEIHHAARKEEIQNDLVVKHEKVADSKESNPAAKKEEIQKQNFDKNNHNDVEDELNSLRNDKGSNEFSETDYPEKESVNLEDEEKTSVAQADKASASNRSAPSHAPRIAPQPQRVVHKKGRKKLDQALFIVVVAACTVAGIAGLVLASYCWYRLRKETSDVPEGEYVKKSKEKKDEKQPEMTDDEKLAKSAEVYHYMHAKKQLAAMENTGAPRKARIDEDESSDEESDNTVYECPGLAPPGDMKVINPLFSDAEREHSDARSDGSHVSSPTRGFSPPQPQNQSDTKQ